MTAHFWFFCFRPKSSELVCIAYVRLYALYHVFTGIVSTPCFDEEYILRLSFLGIPNYFNKGELL